MLWAAAGAALAGCGGRVAGNIREDVAARLTRPERATVNNAARDQGLTSALFPYTIGDVLFRKATSFDAAGLSLSEPDEKNRAALEEAVRFLEEARGKSAAFSDIHFEIGVAHFLLGNNETAVESLQRYVGSWKRSTVTTYYPIAYKVMGYALKADNRPAEARRAFKEYINLVPSGPDAEETLRELDALKAQPRKTAPKVRR